MAGDKQPNNWAGGPMMLLEEPPITAIEQVTWQMRTNALEIYARNHSDQDATTWVREAKILADFMLSGVVPS